MNSEYKGETGKNAYTRGKQHMRGLKSKIVENAFYKHWQNFHETPCEEESLRLNNFKSRVDRPANNGGSWEPQFPEGI